MSSMDWDKSRQIVLTYLNAKYAKFSDFLRQLPNQLFNDPETMETIQVSPSDALREVQNLSELGKKIIVATLRNLDRLQQ